MIGKLIFDTKNRARMISWFLLCRLERWGLQTNLKVFLFFVKKETFVGNSKGNSDDKQHTTCPHFFVKETLPFMTKFFFLSSYLLVASVMKIVEFYTEWSKIQKDFCIPMKIHTQKFLGRFLDSLRLKIWHIFIKWIFWGESLISR